MTDEPKKMLTLAEEVAKVLAAAPKPLALPALKKGLEAAGVSTGKGGITKAQLDAALEGEGVYQHPSKKDAGKPSYWHQPPRPAEEIAAEAAAKEAKTAAAAQAKLDAKAAKEAKVAAAADAKAAKEADAARNLAEKEAKAASVAAAKAAKEADAERKLAEKEAKAAAAADAKAAKEAEAAAAAQAKADAKAAKEAEAARKLEEKANKPFRELREKVHAKVLELGDKIVAGAGLGKPGAKAKPELHTEFERFIQSLIEEKKLFEHPGGKFGRKPYVAPVAPKWYESKAAKGKIQKLIDAAKKVMAIDGATFDDLLPLIQQGIGNSEKDQTTEPSAGTAETLQELPLPEFAKMVMEIVHDAPEGSRFLGDGVYISAAYHAAQSMVGFPALTLGAFKERLLEANREHLLHLSRIDLTRDADQKQLQESKIETAYSTFDLIKTK